MPRPISCPGCGLPVSPEGVRAGGSCNRLGCVPPPAPEPPAWAAMRIPVRCGWCRKVYDLCSDLTITGRWVDCTAWIAPCCGAQVDDRHEYGVFGKVGRPDYERLEWREA